MFLKNNKYRGLIIALIISILVILILFKLIDNADIFINIIKKFISLSMSFIYGVVIAYVLTPIVKLFEKKAKLNRGLSIALTYAILIGSIALLALYAIPNLIDNIKEIGSNIPNYITSIEDMIKHIKHIKNVGGIDVLALGSDFDGIENKVEIDNASEMGKLAFGLEKEGFTYDEIEKIYSKNVIRLFKEVLK